MSLIRFPASIRAGVFELFIPCHDINLETSIVQTRISRKFMPPKELEICWMFSHTYRGLRNKVFRATRETHVSQKVVLKMLFAKY